MSSGSAFLPPEFSVDEIGPVSVRNLNVAGRALKLAVPTEPERLLDVEGVAAAYSADEYMPYWATLWPVSVYLAEKILTLPWPPGLTALEVGCGLGLPGVAALLAGLDLTFSDYDRSALRFVAESARLNGYAKVKTVVADWRTLPEKPYDLVLASDLIYERRNVEPLVRFLASAVAPAGQALVADQNRAFAPEFESKLIGAGFSFEKEAFVTQGVNGSLYWVKR